MFAWLSPIESHVDSKRPKSPSHHSPLLRARTAFTGIRRTFSAGHKTQIQSQRGMLCWIVDAAALNSASVV